MGIEITFTSTHHRVQRNDATRIQVRLQSHQRLFQVKGWSPSEGLLEEPIELSHEIPGMRSAILPGSGDYHLSDPLHIHRQSDRYFRIDGEELSLGSRDAVEHHYKENAVVTFGDLRSAVGRQVISDRRSKPQYGFGSAKRFPTRPMSAAPATPGPGSYNC